MRMYLSNIVMIEKKDSILPIDSHHSPLFIEGKLFIESLELEYTDKNRVSGFYWKSKLTISKIWKNWKYKVKRIELTDSSVIDMCKQR